MAAASRTATEHVRDGGDSAPAHTAVAVVVLTWNGKADTLRCLEALTADLGPGDAVIVVDNASRDGTEDAVSARFPGVRWIRNERNLGFAGGCNVGLRHALDAGFAWCWLLNNDTVPPPGAVDGLRRIAADAEGVGALQPLLVSAHDPGIVDSAGHRLHRLPGVSDLAAGRPVEDIGARRRPVFGACGAAALLRAEALEEVGLLDESLFVLFEDVDLMFRLRAHGWRVELAPSVHVPHRRGVSGRAARSRRARWVHRNVVTLALRWWPAASLWLSSPALAVHALLALGSADGGWRSCREAWGGALRDRRQNRQRLAARGVDRWFGRAL